MLTIPAAFGFGLYLSLTAMVGHGDATSDIENWVETDPPKPGTDRWYKANGDTEHDWVVILRKGRPRARLRNAEDLTVAPLPFEVESGEGLTGRRLSTKVADGWIVGFNHGEFGAGLWWFSPDGRDRYKIAEAWIRDFVPTKAGLLATEGMMHGTTSRGRIIRLIQAPGGRWRSENFVDLKHAPEVCVMADDGSLIVATTDRLLKVNLTTGTVSVLLDRAFWRGLYPRSMVITPKGTVYLGMRHGVARVEKKGKSWTIRWLLPNKEFDKQEAEEGLN